MAKKSIRIKGVDVADAGSIRSGRRGHPPRRRHPTGSPTPPLLGLGALLLPGGAGFLLIARRRSGQNG